MNDLCDNTVFITGGGSDLGLASAERFIEEDTRVATLKLSLAKVASLCQRFSEHMPAIESSITCYADYQRAVDQILTHYGTLDCFAGNAGIWDHNASLVNTPIDTLESGLHELFSIDILGYLPGVKVCVPVLIASEGGTTFTLSNISWYSGGGGPLCIASKHAATGLIHQLVYELVPKIRANGAGPCGMVTDLCGPQMLGQSDTSIMQSLIPEKIAAILPLQSFPEPVDSIGPYVTLASERNNRTLSGATINAGAGLGIRGIRYVAAGLNFQGGVMNPKATTIVGGSQAAAMVTTALRQQGFGGELHLFFDGQHLPYERPSLSKAMLLDDNLQFQPIPPADWWREHNIWLHLGVTVQTLGRQTRQLVLANGQSYLWDWLLITMGVTARPLPQLDKPGGRCFTLRHAGDVERLHDSLLPSRSIVIVGAGTIGLGLVANATQCSCQVMVAELVPTAIGRNTPAPVHDYLLAHHQPADVWVLFNSAIKYVEVRECLSLMLQNGGTLTADTMIYGIGIVASGMLTREAGLEMANDIIADAACITSDLAIFATGDVAITRQAGGSLVRVESWENANFQVQVAATAIFNQPQPAATPNWFWTDQCHGNLQFVGEMQGENWFLRGDPDAQKAIWFNLQDGVIVDTVTLNQGRGMRLLRKRIQAKKKPPAATLVNKIILLKSI